MNWAHLSYGAMAEVAVGVAMLAAALWLYRRPAPATEEGGGGYGSQGAVILFVIGAILGVHALGGFDYHPTQGELESMKGRDQ